MKLKDTYRLVMEHPDEAVAELDELRSRLDRSGVTIARLRHELKVVHARLAEATVIINSMDDHEGAEGWSPDLRERLAQFRKTAADRESEP